MFYVWLRRLLVFKTYNTIESGKIVINLEMDYFHFGVTILVTIGELVDLKFVVNMVCDQKLQSDCEKETD